MSTDKRRTLFKVFQLNYYPLVWTFHTKELNNRINSLHERLIKQNRNSSFDELLKLDKTVSRDYWNLQYLSTEIFKVKMGLSPPITNDILTLGQNTSYNLRFGVTVTRRNRGGSRTAATSKMECFVIIVNGFQLSLTVITKRSILDPAAVLDPALRNIRTNKNLVLRLLVQLEQFCGGNLPNDIKKFW